MTVEHTVRTRVAWVDTDTSGRIHYSAAFRWFEMAETALRRELGILDGWETYPRRRAEAEYLRILVFEDEIDIRVRPERLGQTSITWGFEITRGEELCVRGQLVVVHVDADQRPTPLTGKERALLSGE